MVYGIVHSLGDGNECRRIRRINFGLLSDEEIRDYSVVRVTNPIMYNRGIPSIGGVNDLRMGTIDHRTACGTCGNNLYVCPGHCGHIELPLPVYHGMFVDIVLKTLRVMCFWCSKPLREGADDVTAEERFASVYAECRCSPTCPHCAGQQPTYTKVGSDIAATWDTEAIAALPLAEQELARRPFTAFTARQIFEACDHEDARRLGLNGRPENMVPMTVLVPPPVVRPSVINDARCRGQDDLTHILQSINKRSALLEALLVERGDGFRDEVLARAAELRDLGAAEAETEAAEGGDGGAAAADAEATLQAVDLWEKLQSDVSALYNNTSRSRGQTLQRSGAPTRTLKHRLCGKHGRIRENIMGKRTNMSARSVISPDPTLDLDEIGIPPRIAMTLTVPEPVNGTNLADLTRRVRNGTTHIHGAATIITVEGTLIDLEVLSASRRAKLTLRPAVGGRPGDVVERFLSDGGGNPLHADVVVFNRQPSLHKFSMMGHRVRILPGKTFRMSELAAKPYNADFDGDEMNVHVPQSSAARAEVRELMMVSSLIMSPQGNRPVVGLVQDSLLGAYLLTAPDRTFTRRQLVAMLACVRYPSMYPLPPPALPDGTYRGVQVVSILLPCISLVRRGRDGAADVVVVDGELRQGQLDKATVGASSGGIVQVICQEHGPQRAARFLSDFQSVIMEFLATRGFSIGIGACIMATDADRDRVARAVQNTVVSARSVVAETAEYRRCGLAAEAESATLRITSGAISSVGKAVHEALGRGNALETMVTAGSKGNPVNYTQIMGCVGQNCVDGGRICVGAARTLTCYLPGEQSLESHGFVDRSYIDGLTPPQLFFHAMGGREGLVDTAVRTAVTGYLQRRTIKGLEEKAIGHVAYDPVCTRRPVLSARRAVVQLHYGGDGCDGAKIERVALPHLLQPPAPAWFGDHAGERREWLAVRDALLSHRGAMLGVAIQASAHVPLAVHRALDATLPLPGDDATAERGGIVAKLCTGLEQLMTPEGARPTVYTVRYWLCTAELDRRRLGNRATEALCYKLRDRAAAALVAPGEMVGIVTAQSFGEPLTQMTLNTFHLAGVGNGATQGIGRIKELIDVTRKPKTPVVTLPLVGAIGRTRESASKFARALPRRTLGDLCDPPTVHKLRTVDPHSTVGRAAALGTAATSLHPELAIDAPLNIERCRDADVHATDIVACLRTRLPQGSPVVQCEAVPCVDRIVLLLALPGVPEAMRNDVAARIATKLYESTVLTGCAGITRVSVDKLGGDAHGGGVADTHVVSAADGTLEACLCLGGVDWRHVYSNNVTDVYSVLGVEAARAALLRELLVTISYDGTYIDLRHLQLLADSMCSNGYVMPMSRHGINREKPDETLKKCSYEETMEVLSSAAIFGHTDNMDGVTPSVTFGQYCPSMGTAASGVWYDRRRIGVPRARRSAHEPVATGRRRLVISKVRRYTAQMLAPAAATPKRDAEAPSAPRPAKRRQTTEATLIETGRGTPHPPPSASHYRPPSPCTRVA